MIMKVFVLFAKIEWLETRLKHLVAMVLLTLIHYWHLLHGRGYENDRDS